MEKSQITWRMHYDRINKIKLSFRAVSPTQYEFGKNMDFWSPAERLRSRQPNQRIKTNPNYQQKRIAIIQTTLVCFKTHFQQTTKSCSLFLDAFRCIHPCVAAGHLVNTENF